MFVNPKKWIAVGLLFGALPASAAVVSFGSANNSNSQSFEVTSGTTTITVSAWSDTGGSTGPNSNRDIDIEAATATRYNSGWGITNNEEGTGSPSHSVENMLPGNPAYVDYDFFLLDFGSQSVTLDNAMFSWRYSSTAQNQVSFAALDDSTLDSNLNGDTLPGLINNSLSTASSQMIDGGISGVGSYYADTSINATSSLWIVSAYNSAFGVPSGGASNFDDGFKLAGISFSTPNPSTVPEPTTLAMLGLALCGLTLRKRKNS